MNICDVAGGSRYDKKPNHSSRQECGREESNSTSINHTANDQQNEHLSKMIWHFDWLNSLYCEKHK